MSMGVSCLVQVSIVLYPNVANITRVDLWLQQLMDDLKENNQIIDYNISLAANTLWLIWKSRNEFTFQSSSPNPALVINKALIATKEFVETLSLTTAIPSCHPPPKLMHPWCPQPVNHLKYNVDAAFCSTNNIAALAVVIRDR